MNGEEAYLEAVRTYADGVRVLFAPTGVVAGDRGRTGPTSHSDLADQAEKLVPVSTEVNQAAVARMAEAPAEARADTEIALLAKAVTDLEISAYLYQVAREEEAGREWHAPAADDRSRESAQFAEPYLELLLGEREAPEPEERGPGKALDVVAAREELLESSGSVLFLISRRATKTSKVALQGVMAIGLGELVDAVAIVGMEIAEALGAAEKVKGLYKLFRGFLDSAMGAVTALLGPKLARTVAAEARKWAEKLDLGEHVGTLMEKLYQTQETKKIIHPVIENTTADLDSFVAVIDQVSGLNEKYRQQTELVGTILDKAGWLTAIPAAVLPEVRLLLCAVYLVLAGYVIFLGADYVDAPGAGWVDRVPGVRRVIEDTLAAPQGG
jgi:hypothetical protein